MQPPGMLAVFDWAAALLAGLWTRWGPLWAALGAVYALWLLYLAVMNLRRAKEAGRLSRLVLVLALPIVALAVAVDVMVNLTLATLVFFDRPREWTVSERLARYLPGTDWRAKVALWVGAHLLDPFDPSGQHLRR